MVKRSVTNKKVSGTDRAVRKSSPDKSEKLLEDYADVFADIINVIVYDGKEIVKPGNLLDGPTASMYKAAEGYYGQKERDIAKYDTKNGIAFVLYGLENQMKVSNVMPVRIMGYDYSAYDKNVRMLKSQNQTDGHEADYTAEIWPDQTISPVVTLVLYFGMKPWDSRKTLHEMMDLPDALKPFVPDYPINLIPVAFLPEETIRKFKSDFRIVAEYFRAKYLGKEKQLRYKKKKWIHVAELMEFFRTFTEDERYEELKQFMVAEAREGEVTMCTLLDCMLEEGLNKGIARGLAEGRQKGLMEGRIEGLADGRYRSLQNLMKKLHMPIAEAMEALDFSDEEKAGYEIWREANESSQS